MFCCLFKAQTSRVLAPGNGKETGLCRHKPPHSTSSACRTQWGWWLRPQKELSNVLTPRTCFWPCLISDRVSTKDKNNQVGGLWFSLGLSLPMLFGGDKNAQSQHFDTSLQKETTPSHRVKNQIRSLFVLLKPAKATSNFFLQRLPSLRQACGKGRGGCVNASSDGSAMRRQV